MRLKSFAGVVMIGMAALSSSLPVHAEGNASQGKIKFDACVGCHARPGYANAFPRYLIPKLAGQHADYLKAAWKGFSDGSRKHASMRGSADSLNEQDRSDIAAYLSQLKTEDKNDKITGVPSAGKKLVESCAACHGETGNSENVMFPRLAGQTESYLVHVLQEYKSGARTNAMMNGAVAELSNEAILNISAFYASQPKGLSTVEQ